MYFVTSTHTAWRCVSLQTGEHTEPTIRMDVTSTVFRQNNDPYRSFRTSRPRSVRVRALSVPPWCMPAAPQRDADS